MYQADQFMEYARKFLKQKIEQTAIDEVRDLKQLDEEQNAVKTLWEIWKGIQNARQSFMSWKEMVKAHDLTRMKSLETLKTVQLMTKSSREALEAALYPSMKLMETLKKAVLLFPEEFESSTNKNGDMLLDSDTENNIPDMDQQDNDPEGNLRNE